MRVEHIPNSGWPGRPRNIGIDLARGEFVYFVDNDDWLGERGARAPPRKARPRRLRHRDRQGRRPRQGRPREPLPPATAATRALEWPPLLRLLTPHKLFRKCLPRGARASASPRDGAGSRTTFRRARLFPRAARSRSSRTTPATTGSTARTTSMRRGGASTPSATSTTCARCSTWSRSTPSPARCATGCTPTGTAGRCSRRVGGGPFVRREPRVQPRAPRGDPPPGARALRAGRRDVASVQPPRTLTAPARRAATRRSACWPSSRTGCGADVALREMRWENGTLRVELEAALTVNGGPLVMKRKRRADSLGSSRGAQERAARRGARRHGRASEGAGAGTAPVDAQPGRVRAPDANRAGARERGLRSRGKAPCADRGDRDRRERPPPAPGSPRRRLGAARARGSGGLHRGRGELRAAERGRIRFLPRRERKTLTLTATSDGRLIERTALKRQVTSRLPGPDEQLQAPEAKRARRYRESAAAAGDLTPSPRSCRLSWRSPRRPLRRGTPCRAHREAQTRTGPEDASGAIAPRRSSTSAGTR